MCDLCLSIPEVMRYIGHYQPWSKQETRQFVANRTADYERHGWTMWPLEFKDTGVFIGYCGFPVPPVRRVQGRNRDWVCIVEGMRGAGGLRRRRA